jgi:nitronate monooxygenase
MLLPGIDLPIIQAPMAGVQTSALALAVGRAGGLGSLPCAQLGPDAVRDHLAALAASGRPFNVNFFCHAPPPADAAREVQWRQRLAPTTPSSGSIRAACRTGPGAPRSTARWPS